MTTKPASHSNVEKRAGSHPHAIVLLPCRVADLFDQAAAAGWLTPSSLRIPAGAATSLARLLEVLELPAPRAGHAALRLWGQTGEQAADWVAAADPVWMQAGMERLFVHVPPPGEVGAAELAALFSELQQVLFSDRRLRLQPCGELGYVRGAAPFTTAAVPPSAIDSSRPDAHLPDITDSAARDYYALCSEIEMLLHDHAVNRDREQRGQRPLNGLWLWGGGKIDEPEPRPLPRVFADDPLLKGYCHYSDAACEDWPGALTTCLEFAPEGFIAALPAMSADLLPASADDLKSLWQTRCLQRMTLVFDDAVIEQRRGLRNWLRRGHKRRLKEMLSGE